MHVPQNIPEEKCSLETAHKQAFYLTGADCNVMNDHCAMIKFSKSPQAHFPPP